MKSWTVLITSVLMLTITSMAGCRGHARNERSLHPSEALEILKGGCQPVQDDPTWMCTEEAISSIGHTLIDCDYDHQTHEVEVDYAHRICLNDKNHLTIQRDSARAQRWWFLGAGILGGIVSTVAVILAL
jgi:hypothetical protein